MHIFCSNELIFFLTLNTIDILCLFYSNFCGNKIIFKVSKRSFVNFEGIFLVNWHKKRVIFFKYVYFGV